jgi:polyhydroxyalkanoate synthesis regulator phasin
MPSTALAIARGLARGGAQRQDDERKQQREDLETMIQLGQIPGVSIEDIVPAPDPATPVVAPTPAAGSAAAQRGVLDAAHQAWKSSVAGDTPGAPVAAAAAAVPAPAQQPAATSTPRSPLEIGRIALGGTDRRVTMDPTLTAGGRQKANQVAHSKLFAIDESIGDFDPSEDYQTELRKYNKRKQVADALVKTGEFTQDQADTYAKTGEDLAEKSRKAALEQATIDQRKRQHVVEPGTPGYYAMVREVAKIRAQYSKGGANADPAKAKEKWVRSRMVQLMKSPGKDPDLGTALPGLAKDEAIQQASDEWDAVTADSEETPASTAPSGTPKKTPAPANGENAEKIKTLNAQYKAAIARGVDEDKAWEVYQSELAKIKAAGVKRAPGK